MKNKCFVAFGSSFDRKYPLSVDSVTDWHFMLLKTRMWKYRRSFVLFYFLLYLINISSSSVGVLFVERSELNVTLDFGIWFFFTSSKGHTDFTETQRYKREETKEKPKNSTQPTAIKWEKNNSKKLLKQCAMKMGTNAISFLW